MELRSILVPVGRGSFEAALLAGLSVASRFGGVVRALYPKGEAVSAGQFRYPTIGDGVLSQVADISRGAGETREARARAAFDALAARAGDGALRWEEFDADGPDAISYQGALFDLLVLSAVERNDPDMVEAALFRAGRPVLFVPDGFTDGIGTRIVVGWNRTVEAGHALAAALPLMRKADSVVICAVHTAAKRGPPAEAAVEYLSAHAVAAEIASPDAGRRPIGAVLHDHARSVGADLLVAGANYQGRLRETRPGGVTGYLLHHATLPLLMAH